MQVLVINLPDSKKRFNFQAEQLNRLGLDYKVIEAVSTVILSKADKLLSQSWQRPMRKSEVACFLSHKKAWQAVADANKAALIIEDDALFSKNVPVLLSQLSSLTDIDLITLEIRSRKKIVSNKHRALCCNSTLLELYQDRTGAAGYVLWPDAAKKLIAKSDKGRIGLADAFISSRYELRAFQVEPAAIIQLDQCENYGLECGLETQSTITPVATQHPVPLGFLSVLRFKLKRIQAQMSMGLRHLSVLHKSERRFIKLNISDFKR